MGVRLEVSSKTVDLAAGITPTAAGGSWSNLGNITDANDTTYGTASLATGNKGVTVQLPSPKPVNKVRVVSEVHLGDAPAPHVYLYYWDGSAWIPAVEWNQVRTAKVTKEVSFGPITASLWWLVWTTGGNWYVYAHTFSLFETGYPTSGNVGSVVLANPASNFTRLRFSKLTRTTVDVDGNPVAEAGAVRLYLSPDDGATYFLMGVGDEITPLPTGNQLKYRMDFTADPVGNYSPDVSYLELAYAT